jgi:tRNA (guanine26-N2/guanine27-N2)-dimethyltransferase
MLTLISEELSNSPLYYTLDHLSSVVHCTTPSMIQLRSAIMRCGYEVSGSHAAKLAIKTSAPNNGKNEKISQIYSSTAYVVFKMPRPK